MTTATSPLRFAGGGGGNYAPTQQGVREFILGRFPGITRSKAKKVAEEAVARRRMVPDLDVFAWSVDRLRPRQELRLRGADPTPPNAIPALRGNGPYPSDAELDAFASRNTGRGRVVA